jgi:hypothetical protein
VTRRRLARVFWLGAAAILVAAALVSLVAILGGGFSDTDGRILGTLGSLLYCGAAALSGLALVDRRLVPPLGWAMVGLAAVTFALLVGAIWELEDDGDTTWRLALSGALFLLAGLVATTGLLLTTRPALQRLAIAAGILAATAVSLTLVPIWRDEDPGSTLGKAIGVAWILAALAYLLAPVLQRWSAVGDTTTGERALGTLDGVELVATREPGDALVVTERPKPGERLVLRRRGPSPPTEIV